MRRATCLALPAPIDSVLGCTRPWRDVRRARSIDMTGPRRTVHPEQGLSAANVGKSGWLGRRKRRSSRTGIPGLGRCLVWIRRGWQEEGRIAFACYDTHLVLSGVKEYALKQHPTWLRRRWNESSLSNKTLRNGPGTRRIQHDGSNPGQACIQLEIISSAPVL